MIELLRNAWKKGLEPEDYDASRWDSRLHAMQGSAADPAALVRYTELARADDGEQLPVPAKPVDPGQSYPDAARLVRILQLLGDLPTDTARPTDSPLYDGTLAEAVKRFQRRHGPDADGRLGPAAVNQLNVPLTDRVRQLQLTLERWRWLPTEYSAPPIIVNIPDFRLRALDENKIIALETRVVVGTMRSETPVFWRDMTYLVLRPYWNVPQASSVKTSFPRLNGIAARLPPRTTKSPLSMENLLPREQFPMKCWRNCRRGSRRVLSCRTRSLLCQIISRAIFPALKLSFPFFNSSITCDGVMLSRCSFVSESARLVASCKDNGASGGIAHVPRATLRKLRRSRAALSTDLSDLAFMFSSVCSPFRASYSAIG